MTVDSVKISIYTWGVYPAVVLLKEFQQKQHFEFCAIIKQAIDEVLNGSEYRMSSKVDDSSIEETLICVSQGRINPTVFKKNMPHYIEEMRKSILK